MSNKISNKVSGSTLRFLKGILALLLSSAAFLLFLALITIAIKLVR